MKAKKVKLGKKKYDSRSQAALHLLKCRASGQNKFSKAEIARKVGMTSQTVHAVQKNAGLDIDFASESPSGRPKASPKKKK